MRLPEAIEREIQAIEREIASRGGQQVGPPWLRELRAAIGLELQRVRIMRDLRRAESTLTDDEKLEHLITVGRALLKTWLDGYHPTEAMLNRFDGALAAYDTMLLCGHRLMDDCMCNDAR